MKGSLRERSPGVWTLRVYIGDDPATGRPLQASRSFRGGRRAAESELARFVTEADGRRRHLAGTVEELLARWIEHLEARGRRKSTIDGYRQKIDRDIVPALGAKKLDKLRAADLDRWYTDRLADGLSRTTVHHFHAILHAALAQAVRWGLVVRNVADDADPPPLQRRQADPPSVEEVRALLARAAEGPKQGPRIASLLFVAAASGARRSELCALRWSDVDVARRTLRIRGTKTHSSYRTVALDDGTLAVLAYLRAWQEDLAVRACTKLTADPYIFAVDPDGERPTQPQSASQAIRRLSGGRVHFHQLRHFAATQLLGAGVDVRTVAGRLGHGDATTTLRIYSHFLEQRDQVAAGILGQLLAPAELPAGA